MPFGRLLCAENILLNDSTVKNRVIVQEYGVSFNSIGIVQEFVYISFRGVSGRQMTYSVLPVLLRCRLAFSDCTRSNSSRVMIGG